MKQKGNQIVYTLNSKKKKIDQTFVKTRNNFLIPLVIILLLLQIQREIRKFIQNTGLHIVCTDKSIYSTYPRMASATSL